MPSRRCVRSKKYAPNMQPNKRESETMSRNRRKIKEKLEPAKGIEPPTYGLRNHSRPVPPVWNPLFSIGSSTPHSGHIGQLGHEHAPENAPQRPTDYPLPYRRRFGGLVPARSIVLAVRISKRCMDQLEAIRLNREQRETDEQQLAFHARSFVRCGIPLRRMARDRIRTPDPLVANRKTKFTKSCQNRRQTREIRKVHTAPGP